MARKNSRARDNRLNDFYRKDEIERAEKLKRKRESRLANAAKRAEEEIKKNSHKKAKKKPVVAETKRMHKMMKKMQLGSGKNMNEGSSDSSDWEDQPDDKADTEMDIGGGVTKTIAKKKKPLSRSYYEALKKNIRRRVKDGSLPNLEQLDKILKQERMQIS